ncbi:MAG: flagellar FlbD family protein [Bacillota bacterium]|nr:flagellar FlbD family protein [Bacillota bacterium]
MIRLTAFSGDAFVLNADHIEKVEEVPECIITLVNGKKYMVRETSEEVIDKVIEYKKKIFNFGL